LSRDFGFLGSEIGLLGGKLRLLIPHGAVLLFELLLLASDLVLLMGCQHLVEPTFKTVLPCIVACVGNATGLDQSQDMARCLSDDGLSSILLGRKGTLALILFAALPVLFRLLVVELARCAGAWRVGKRLFAVCRGASEYIRGERSIRQSAQRYGGNHSECGMLDNDVSGWPWHIKLLAVFAAGHLQRGSPG
jgi:hypothetical protein